MSGEILYNDPAGGSQSEVDANVGGSQIRTDFFYKKSLVEAAKEQYFGQMASVRGMPKNMGKTIKQYHYMPILDDTNINDQGLDASGAVIAITEYAVRAPDLVNSPTNVEALEASFAAAHSDGDWIFITDSSQWLLLTADTAIGYDASTTGGADGTEKADADVKAALELDTAGITATVVNDSITVDSQDLVFSTQAAATAAGTIIAGSTVAQRSGNLYGSSKDVGYITGKIPTLSESGGRVNRVGMARLQLTGSIEKFGLFDEYSQESVDFDSDAELEMHIISESVKAANELTEDQLQIDLLNSAGVTRYTGTATSKATLQGNDATSPFDSGSTNDVVNYDDLVKLAITLDNNRTPKKTTLIAGSRMVDTKVVNAARYIYIGSELQPSVMRMTDYHGNKAFIPVAQYASAGNIARGEFGAIDNFRFIVVPEMMKFAGQGAVVTTNGGFQETNNRFDVFPMLVVGDGSFTTIGFQTDGKTVKFKIKHVKPGSDISYSKDDPYGEMGFYSIKWYYGIMILRSERIAIVYTIAEE